ncbi:MAG: hypothetical protein AAFO07_29615 [Bacteroidota bacterium]
MFLESYPNLSWWIKSIGWIVLGSDDYSNSWLRVLDEGGMCWEDKDSKSLDEALEKADKFIEENYE